ncbi:MAG: transglutaminase family protein [Rhodospirillales bacterium]|nr:transglutaminase family protein [Rhodospirillales bacterium]
MSIHAALRHRTRYIYDRKVEMGPQIIRLRPAPHARTPVLSFALNIKPEGYFINWQQDPHGNYQARVVFPDPVDQFEVEIDLVADMSVQNPFDFFLEPEAEELPFAYDEDLKQELESYLQPEPAGPLFTDWLASLAPREGRTVEYLVALNQRLQGDIEYLIRMEPGVQTCEETLHSGKGSCRDTGWFLVEALRHLGFAARFVSGYLIQLKADMKSLDGPSGAEQDFTDLHAWAEVYLPGAGWVGLDPTSGLLAGEGHIPLAATPRPRSAAPITGAVEECEVTFDFEMEITRISESPRVTKPYSEEQWQTIDRLGEEIDKQLAAQDVRLTLGGEPTFISIDHVDEDEWNTAAVGKTKRPLADDLIRRLRDKYAPGGLLHYGQGKWYPGEPLPRWAFALYWRADGKPIWRDQNAFAREVEDHKPDIGTAEVFTRSIAERLGVSPDAALAAYEDPWHFMEQERRLPANVTLEDSKLDDPLERERLGKVFSRGLSKPTGFVLPVQRWNARDKSRRWFSEPWSMRTSRLVLVPGDSPVGYRLPLASLDHISPVDYPYVIPADPFAERSELADPEAQRQPYLQGSEHPGAGRQNITQQSASGAKGRVRAAMTIEPRDGRLCVFMPPTETLEDYLDLIAAIEDAVAESGLPVHIEGYEPPKDPRLNVIKVTPDPGVLEVNIHPAANWREMVDNTETLYEEARLSRLGTEKFMLDGRHTGTGGGNHVVCGGPTAKDSPFLRRPDLLKSLITYWQHHPSLSYLFSGMFVGPTSQAPRIDEARHDGLYELEIALSQIPPMGTECPPWFIDRTLRNLLIDVSGNTHRTEICIDKLYSPDGPTGRLGLVEFRAFEMPPHERMSLTQQLLLRGLIARFWETPYEGPLVRWGTRLHDRFMLPRSVWADFEDVIEDMKMHGYAFESDWFAPHFEFRFPRYGAVKYQQIEIELRQALEPWHVMGEEGATGGTVRYVDSSVERLQVLATGFTDERYQLACNGYRVPLTASGRNGECFAGVRFRAWKPASALHPGVGVDAPLTFDLYDNWTGRAVAGCTYHVAHPGGRNFEHFPVNSYEAESRRLARFFDTGHTPGASAPPVRLENNEFPMTLDLRRTKSFKTS